MDTSISTNVLFYVLSIFFILVTVGCAIVLILLISVLKAIKWEIEKIGNDIEVLRNKMKDGGMMMTSVLMSLASFFKNRKKK